MNELMYDFNRRQYYRRCYEYGVDPLSPICLSIEEAIFPKQSYLVPHAEIENANKNGVVMIKQEPRVLHVGDKVIDRDTDRIWEYVVDKKTGNSFCLKYVDTIKRAPVVIDVSAKSGETVTKKIAPHPTNCKNCGAVLNSYTCEYCGTEYPKI